MANFTFNWLTFPKEESRTNEVIEMFKELAEKNTVSPMFGQLPTWMGDRFDGYFFDVAVEENDGVLVTYRSKYEPNRETIVEIGKHYGVSLDLDYDESASGLYGRLSFDAESGTFVDHYLDENDLKLFSLDEESGMTLFEGELWNSGEEVKEALLLRKIQPYEAGRG